MKLLYNILGQRRYDKAIRKMGLMSKTHVKIRKLSAWSSEDLRTVSILNNFGITKVLDVGANVGQFAESLLDYGYKGSIVSFEPTAEAHSQVSKKANDVKNWTVAERCAIADFDGEIEINVAENTVFSSVKGINTEYSDYNNESKIVAKEKVRAFKMDSVWENYCTSDDQIFLKVDTQGFEKEVIAGSAEMLKHVKGIKIEAPLQTIYNNVSWGIVEMLNFFEQNQFKCVSISEVGVNKKTGIVYEVDMILMKEDLLDTQTLN